MEIKTKRKYLHVTRGRFKGGERFAPKKNRTKIGDKKHFALYGEPRQKVMVVDGLTGHRTMQYVQG